MNPYEKLQDLRDVVALKKTAQAELDKAGAKLRSKIADLQAQLLTETKAELEAVNEAAALESELRQEVNEWYQEQYHERQAALMRGEEVPEPELPDGISFGSTLQLTVDCESAIPKSYYCIDEKRIKATLKDGKDVPGARLLKKWSVRVS